MKQLRNVLDWNKAKQLEANWTRSLYTPPRLQVLGLFSPSRKRRTVALSSCVRPAPLIGAMRLRFSLRHSNDRLTVNRIGGYDYYTCGIHSSALTCGFGPELAARVQPTLWMAYLGMCCDVYVILCMTSPRINNSPDYFNHRFVRIMNCIGACGRN